MTKLIGWKMGIGLSLWAATAVIAAAQTFSTLQDFDVTDGAVPFAGLVQATDGNLYGTTLGGGSNGSCLAGCGTVFKMAPSGTLTTIYSFCIQPNCADGAWPYFGSLVEGADGNFYGTTAGAGANWGTVFKVTREGVLTTLHTFCVQDCTDGAAPFAGLVQGTDGNFYGTTWKGGAGGAGTVFKITPGGTLTTLHAFCLRNGCPDGSFPYAGLIQGADGNFYGTTTGGLLTGTVFRITKEGTLTTVYTFCSKPNCADGANPYAGLVEATDGNFYGTTWDGGASGYGTVFKISREGALTTLYSFCAQGNCTDGANPRAGLLQATDGNLYGTTYAGGAMGNCPYGPEGGCGTVFRLTRNGVLTTLHTFCLQSDCPDGSAPYAGLFQQTSGGFYGTTTSGGPNNSNSAYGTVFSLSVRLGPFVSLARNPAEIGQTFGVLGQGFVGTTSVSLNGTLADFTIKSATFIEATVPEGATTGYVTVTTPTGVLKSNVPFRVIQ